LDQNRHDPPYGAKARLSILRQVLSDELGGIAGFVPADEAVEKSSDKKAVLARMEKSRRDWLPVVNKESKILEGVVDRSRLAASILLDVTKRLEGKKCRRSNQNQPAGVESKPATFFL
jgi:hypothetical protein